MKKTPIILLSQHLDLKNKDWQKAGCGIVSLLMLMEHQRGAGQRNKFKLPDINKLYQAGLNRRAYIKGVGWRHTGLVGLAKIYGFKQSQAYDLANQPDKQAKQAEDFLKGELAKSPVIASVYSKYEPGRGGHLAVLLSLSSKKAILLDPDSRTREGIYKEIEATKFIAAWKKRFIVVQ
jgi:hypothetical protein